jgi:phosphoglycerate dehydrogenase-like enzyme
MKDHMDRLRIAVLDDYNGAARRSADWGQLAALGDVTFFSDHVADQEALAARLRDFEVVVVERERTPFRRALFRALPRLKLLIATGPVNWSLDLEAAAEHGVLVGCTEARQDLTPELTMGLIVALCRRIVFEDRGVREGCWQTGIGEGLAGKTLGLMGLGRVGAGVARLARAFGMDVAAWSPNLTDAACEASGVRRASRDTLLSQSDVISIHLVLGERSRGSVDRHAFAQMKSTAYVVNTARGPIVDEAALIEALSERRIAGAALDVFDVEPLPADHRLRSLDNVILTPHIGYIDAEQCRLFYGQVVEQIMSFAHGGPVRRLASA